MSREQALNQVCLSKTETFSIKSAPHSIPQDWIGFSASPQQQKTIYCVNTQNHTSPALQLYLHCSKYYCFWGGKIFQNIAILDMVQKLARSTQNTSATILGDHFS